MAWGSSANARVRMNYKRIKQAITDKGNRGRVGEVQIGRNVWARLLHNNAIAVKLHNTDIITYYEDGSATLDGGGWISSQLTRHWFGEAGYRVYSHKINDWTGRVYMLGQYGGTTQFYNGMRVDAQGQLIGAPRPIVKLVPNAEAKVLRKQMLAIYNEHYLPHLRMLDLMDRNEWKKKTGYVVPDSRSSADLTTVPDEPFDVVIQVLSPLWPGDLPSKLFKNQLDAAYVALVHQRKLFDEVSYQPKEN